MKKLNKSESVFIAFAAVCLAGAFLTACSGSSKFFDSL